jgi:hypothetical protein
MCIHIHYFAWNDQYYSLPEYCDPFFWDVLYRQAIRRVIIRIKEKGGSEDRSLIQANRKAGSK